MNICAECAERLGYRPKDKVAGVWMDECGFCRARKPVCDSVHDYLPPKKERVADDAFAERGGVIVDGAVRGLAEEVRLLRAALQPVLDVKLDPKADYTAYTYEREKCHQAVEAAQEVCKRLGKGKEERSGDQG